MKKIFLALVMAALGIAPITVRANSVWADDMPPGSEVQNTYIQLRMYFPNEPSSQSEYTEDSNTSTVPGAKEQALLDKSEAKAELPSSGENQSTKDLIAAGDVALDKEQKAQARTLFGQATVELQKSPGENKIELAKVLNKLASTYDLTDSSEREQAKANYKKAIYINKSVDSDIQAAALSKLSIIAMTNGQLSQAETLGRQSLEVSKTAFGEGAPQTGESLIRLAVVLHSNNKIAEAEPLAQQARDIFEKVNDSNKLAASLAELASLRMAQNDAPGAEKLYEQQLSVLEAAQLNHSIADCLEHLGSIQKGLGKEPESQSSFRKALELRETSTNEKIFRFIDGAPNCAHVFDNGAVTEQIDAAGLRVLTAMQRIHDKVCADVKIVNSGDKPIDISPSNIKLIIEPQSKQCKQVDVDQWARSMVHSARVAAECIPSSEEFVWLRLPLVLQCQRRLQLLPIALVMYTLLDSVLVDHGAEPVLILVQPPQPAMCLITAGRWPYKIWR